jgi:hypothetical protein
MEQGFGRRRLNGPLDDAAVRPAVPASDPQSRRMLKGDEARRTAMIDHWNETKNMPDFSLDAVIDINPWRRREPDKPARNSGYEFFIHVLISKNPMTVREAIEVAKCIDINEKEVQLHLKWLQSWPKYASYPPIIT